MALVLSAALVFVRAGESPAAASRVAAHPIASRRVPLSMAQAVRLAQRRFRARVVRAETQMQGDRTIYVLRMLDDAGRVFPVRVDAASGTII